MASTSHTASQARGSKPVLESHVDGRVVRLAGGGGHWAIESITYSEWRPGDWTASKKRKKGENQMGRILLGCDTATRGPMRGNGRVRTGGCFPLTLLQLGALGRGTKILHLCWVGCPRLGVGAGRLRKDVALSVLFPMPEHMRVEAERRTRWQVAISYSTLVLPDLVSALFLALAVHGFSGSEGANTARAFSRPRGGLFGLTGRY